MVVLTNRLSPLGADAAGMIGNFSKAPLYFFVSMPPKIIAPDSFRLVTIAYMFSPRTFRRLYRSQIETESAAIRDTLLRKFVDNIQVGHGSAHRVERWSNTHDSSRDIIRYLCDSEVLTSNFNPYIVRIRQTCRDKRCYFSPPI